MFKLHAVVFRLIIPIQALESLLPPKKKDLEPLPAIVDEVPYEESDIGELRSSFLDGGLDGHFGDHDSDWEDESDDDDEPECRPQ